jgi:hypothetical protein
MRLSVRLRGRQTAREKALILPEKKSRVLSIFLSQHLHMNLEIASWVQFGHRKEN